MNDGRLFQAHKIIPTTGSNFFCNTSDIVLEMVLSIKDTKDTIVSNTVEIFAGYNPANSKQQQIKINKKYIFLYCFTALTKMKSFCKEYRQQFSLRQNPCVIWMFLHSLANFPSSQDSLHLQSICSVVFQN